MNKIRACLVLVLAGYRQAIEGCKRLLERAGVVPWPKPFVNLRSTRRTELQELFPDHVVNAWLGHSGAVAAKHCLQVTDEHWDRAVKSRPLAGPLTATHPEPSSESADIKKPRENPGFDGSRWLPDSNEMTPTGFEQSAETGEESGAADLVYPPVYPSRPIGVDADAEELLAIWAELDGRGRADLLAVARGLAAHDGKVQGAR